MKKARVGVETTRPKRWVSLVLVLARRMARSSLGHQQLWTPLQLVDGDGAPCAKDAVGTDWLAGTSVREQILPGHDRDLVEALGPGGLGAGDEQGQDPLVPSEFSRQGGWRLLLQGSREGA